MSFSGWALVSKRLDGRAVQKLTKLRLSIISADHLPFDYVLWSRFYLLSMTRNPLRLIKHFFFANAQEFAHTNVVVVTLPARSLGACLISIEVRVHDWPSRNNSVYLSTYLRAMFIGTSVVD
jgi:hypothetical protein